MDLRSFNVFQDSSVKGRSSWRHCVELGQRLNPSRPRV